MARAHPRRLPRPRLRRPRVTFATRLLLGGFALSLAIIAAISAFLLVSQDQQARSNAESNARSRAQAFAELVLQVSAPQARFAAADVAGLPEMAAALTSSHAATAVGALLQGSTAVAITLPDEQVAVLDAGGTVLATGGDAAVPGVSAGLPAVSRALTGSVSESVDLIGPDTPVYDFAAPVKASGGRVLGAVVYSMPLSNQLMRLVGALGSGYTPVLVPNRRGAPLQVLSGSADQPVIATGPLPAALARVLGGSQGSLSGFTSLPAAGATAVALQSLSAPSGAPAVYVGVETPLSLYTAGQTADELTVVWLALTALLVTWLLVLLFVNRFVRRPVAQLSAGVTRIAGGDYSSDIPVASQDELGILAKQVNRMRAQIESNVRHVDHAVARLEEVSRALTTTTTGVSSLESAVCAAAASIAGPGARAWILARDGDTLRLRAHGPGQLPDPVLPERVLNELLAGRTARFGDHGNGSRWSSLALPMAYQEEIRGAMVVTSTLPLSDADARALSAVANNAAVALENTRLFEGERETVRRLRELDEMKSDFLATAQHELRTPLTAVLGHLELIRMVWADADEGKKLGLLDNIELAANQLADMLETMIDLSLVSADSLRVQRGRVGLSDAVRDAIGDVARRHPRGLPVRLQADVPHGVALDADPERLRQVLRCLLDNAVKFTREGGEVTIAAQLAGAGDRCAITVSDTGIGIDPALHARVFERFFQVDSGGTRAYGGMGVGLALVKVLAEAHGATVRLQSALGAGTAVTLDWPCAQPPEGGADAEQPVDLTAHRSTRATP